MIEGGDETAGGGGKATGGEEELEPLVPALAPLALEPSALEPLAVVPRAQPLEPLEVLVAAAGSVDAFKVGGAWADLGRATVLVSQKVFENRFVKVNFPTNLSTHP